MRSVRSTIPIRARSFAIASAMLLSALSSNAFASDAAAAEAFKAGASAYQKSDYRGAAAAFERAFKESPRGAAIYNAGLAWEAAGEGPRAADAYAAALDLGDLGAQQKKDAQTRLGNLEKMLGRLEITGPAGATVTVAHREGATLPAKIHVTAGSHEIAARFDGGASSRPRVNVAAGGVTPFALETPRSDIAGVPLPSPAPPPVEKREPPPPSSGTSARKITGFVALGGAVIASGLGVTFGLAAISAKNDFNDSGHRDQSAHDRADSLRTVTNIAWVAAGVLAATGVVLVVTAPKNGASSATATVGPAGGAITVRF